ncbi:unnamed protein product, partial [marine sediment metagenome]
MWAEARMSQERKDQRERNQLISTLSRQARALTSEHKYKDALDIHKKIIQLDPNNRYAIERKELLEQFIILQKEKRLDVHQRTEEQKVLVDVRESQIPWYELQRYPRDWRELTMRRERFGA